MGYVMRHNRILDLLDDRSIILVMSGSETKAEIVRIGAEIIGESGFNSTGLEAILKKAKVPKGSFYYYFSSKDDFGLAVIDQGAVDFANQLRNYLRDTAYPPVERLRKCLENSLAMTESNRCKKGCLIGTLGQELAGQNEKFRKRIDEVFQSWKAIIADCLEEAKSRGDIAKSNDCDQLADFLLTGWEGAILRAKVMKSVRPMRDFIDIFFGTILTKP